MPRKPSSEEICSWINTKLSENAVSSLPELSDGVVFCRLVELFTKQRIVDVTVGPKSFDEKVANVGLAVGFIESSLHARVEKVRFDSVAMGDIGEITSLISFIIQEFDPASSLSSGLETRARKRKLSGAHLEYSTPAILPGKGPKICDPDNEKKKQRNGYFRWPVESTTEMITTNTLPIITLRKKIYEKFQYDVESNEAPTMDDINKVIAEETRLIDTSASIHQQEVEYKIATKMTIKELQSIGKRKYENGKGLDSFPGHLTSQLPGIVVCDLSCNKLSTFPTALLMGKSLEEIQLSCNRIRTLPSLEGPEVHLNSLTTLDLSLNPIEYLPASLFYLPKLEALILSRCHLRTLELPLEGLRPVGPSLRRLDLSHNLFQTLPDGLAILRKLEVLNLNSNQLTKIPRCVSELPVLCELWASGNQLGGHPGPVPETLRLLVANGNRLEGIPREWALPQLAVLSLAHNRISKVRSDLFDAYPELTSLDLSGNRLGALPRVTGRKLAALRVAGNRLADISFAPAALAGLVVLDVSFTEVAALPDLAPAKGLEVLCASHTRLGAGAGALRAGTPRTLVRLGLAGCDLGDFDWCESVLSFPRLETLLLQGSNIRRIELQGIAASKALKFADLSHNPFLSSTTQVPVMNDLYSKKALACSVSAAPWGSAQYSDPRAPGAGSYSLPLAVEGIAQGCALYGLCDSCGADAKRTAQAVTAAVVAAVRRGLGAARAAGPEAVTGLLADAIRGANGLFSDDPMDPIQGCGVLLALVDTDHAVAYTAALGSAAAALVANGKSARWIAEGQDPLSDAEYARVHEADPAAFVTKDGRLMGIYAGSRGLGCKILGKALSVDPVVNVTGLEGGAKGESFVVLGSERVWKMAPLNEFIAPFVVEYYKKSKGNASLTAACLRDWCLGSCADDYQNYNAFATLVVPISK